MSSVQVALVLVAGCSGRVITQSELGDATAVVDSSPPDESLVEDSTNDGEAGCENPGRSRHDSFRDAGSCCGAVWCAGSCVGVTCDCFGGTCPSGSVCCGSRIGCTAIDTCRKLIDAGY